MWIVKNMDMVSIFGLMEDHTEGIGLKENSKVGVFIKVSIIKNVKVNGQMAQE